MAARGQLDVLKWLCHLPSQQPHAIPLISRALQSAAQRNQAHVVQYLLRSLPCPLNLNSTALSVEAWHVFTSLVRWARRRTACHSETSLACDALQGPIPPIQGLLRHLADLPPDLVQRIACDGLLCPTEATQPG